MVQSLTRHSAALTLPNDAPSPASPDADMLALGRRRAIQDLFEARQAQVEAMSDAELAQNEADRLAVDDALFNQGCALFDEIARTPARRMDGLALDIVRLARYTDAKARSGRR